MLRWSAQKLSTLIPSSILASSSNASESDTTVTDLKELKELERTMKRIQAMASDAEQRGVKDQTEKLRLEELKDVAYDADDVVDEYEFEVLAAKIRDGVYVGDDNYKHKREDEVIFSQLIVPVPNELAIRVKEIRERFDRIISEWDALRWGEGESHARYEAGMVTMPESTSLVHEPSIHGRDNDKEIIIEKIISGDTDHNGVGSLSVLPLVGMGGIGKTTLAQLVFNDQRVCEYFQLRAWVCVSDNFSLEVITRNIIVSLTKKACDFTVLNDLQTVLANEVKGKRFLIILDDVWNEKPSLWHALRAPLIGTGFGTIIVTTRNNDVARYMKTMDSYALPYLSFEDCWSLFKQLAFECQDPNSNPRLLEIGRKIIEKCKGLPLAVKALGSLLRFEPDEENWEDILDSEIWESELKNSDILPALKISYDRLPIHLKQCFVFLSLYPKDYVICEDDIVNLWSSQGIVHPEGRKSIEDTCVGYITDLLQRSMIQLTDGIPGSDGSKRYFIMHDLVNDLAQSVSGKEFSRVETDKLDEVSSEVRYISIIYNYRPNSIDFQRLNHLKAPRLIKVIRNSYSLFDCRMDVIPPENFQMLKHVRYLDLKYSNINTLDDSSRKLKQLRYLNISQTNIKKLPDSICDLYNLQTLDLSCSNIKTLDDSIGKLKQLRYLYLSYTKIQKLPDSICGLYNLQTLYLNRSKINTLNDSIGKLKQLRYLNLNYTTIEKLPNSICGLRNLQTLDLVVFNNSFKELPIKISNLVNLQHLELKYDVCIPRGIRQLLKLKTLSYFIIKPGTWHCELSELKNLTNLKGELYIKGLEHVTSVKDAEEARLCNKIYLKKLILDWCGGESCHHSNECVNVVVKPTKEQLLEALRPHVNIEELELWNFCVFSYPSWLGDTSFSKLVKFIISGFDRMSTLPTLGQLPSLTDIIIKNMSGIKVVGREFCSHDSESVGFRSLKTLDFSHMSNWVKWSGVENGDFCSLHTLSLTYCPRLEFIPESLCSILSTLVVYNCPMLKAPHTFPSLNCLILRDEFNEVFSDGSLYLPLLKSLEVYSSSIISLILNSRNLPSIESINILRCKELENVIGLSNLNSLNELSLDNCPKLQFASDELLPYGVQRLTIYRCPHLHEWEQIQIRRN